MKWVLSLVLALCMVTPAFAGEDPYIAIVGVDCVPGVANFWQREPCMDGDADPFYFSPKYSQFMYDEFSIPFMVTASGGPASQDGFPPVNKYTRVGARGTEQFRANGPTIVPDVCFVPEAGLTPPTLFSAKVGAGNVGFFEYFIRLPKKPDGEINIVIECGVLKPNTFFVGVEGCAAETGERLGGGICTRQEVEPGVSPVIQAALPRLTAIAYPGDFNDFAPFHLTAFRNPGTYTLAFDAAGAMTNNAATQVLDMSVGTRIMLKACLDKTVIAKLPVTGQLNALAETETDLEAGDWIYVRIDVPRQNTVDIYCNSQSVRIAGIGETPL